MRLTLSSVVLNSVLTVTTFAMFVTTTCIAKEYGTITGWGTLIDPDGDCSFVIADDRVSIQVPDTPHGLSAELNRVNAPRILREVSGDFTIEVTIDGIFAPGAATVPSRTPYNGAGLLLWQDEKNYIRLERAVLKRNDHLQHYVNFEQRLLGRVLRIGIPTDFEVDESRSCRLRLVRKAQRVLGFVKQGDDEWHALPPKAVRLPEKVKVGIAAINAADTPFAPQFSSMQIVGGDTDLAVKKMDAEETPAEEKDPYAVPDTGVDGLIDFIKEVKAIRPKTREEYIAHLRNSPKALATAADKILESDSPPLEAIEVARRIRFEQKIGQVTRLEASKQQSLFDEIMEFCSESEAYAENAQLVSLLARGLEYGNQGELAAESYLVVADLMTRSGSDALVKRAEKMTGAARRLRLPGNEMRVQGVTREGEPFDLADYRGKVVLVDFWATWCGPCIAELPNVKKQYELYHDKGFEVVGVCLDTSREKLDAFVEAQDIPWLNLFEDDAGWDHSVANYYGVMAIPTVILINREGHTISMKARGKELARLLEEELGPVEKATEDKEVE